MRNKAIQSISESHKNSLTLWQFFRLVFVLFSLYLMGDAFYRWDAFKLYGSFSDFLLSISLASILWSLLAIFNAFLIWIFFKAIERSCAYCGLKIKMEILLIYSVAFMILALSVWVGKKLVWSDVQMTLQLKLSIITFISCASILPAWLLRNKSVDYISIIQGRITPLVWMFGFFILFSIPLLSYYTWGKTSVDSAPRQLKHVPVSKLDQKKPNILLVTFDALTARDMSVYNYSKPTTPFIEKWTKKASLFSMAEADSNYTGPTTASLMTGKRGWTHRRYSHDKAARPYKSSTENIAFILKKHGYFNYAFTMNVIASVEALGISSSFDIAPLTSNLVNAATIQGFIEKYLYQLFGNKFKIHNWLGQDDFILSTFLRIIPQKVFTTEYPPENAFNMFLETIDNNPVEPFFAWIHIFPPHAPYLPPKPYAGMFNKSSEMRDFNLQKMLTTVEVRKYNHENQYYPEDIMRKINLLRDYYDEFILYCDKQFEVFIREVDKRSWSGNTVIIMSSDHGESFRREYFYHGGPYLYEQVTHIPLIIKEPDQIEERIIDDVVSQIDIPATILELANIPIPSWMEGQSLVPLLRDMDISLEPVMSMTLYENNIKDPINKGTIAMRKDNYKLIHYLEDEKSLLFNLKNDPDEMNNLINKEPVVRQQLLGLIKDNLKKANENIIRGE